MKQDAPRNLLMSLMSQNDEEMKFVSEDVLGKNHAYIHQYLFKNKPIVMPESVRELLGKHYNVDPDLFRAETDPKRAEAERLARSLDGGQDLSTNRQKPSGARDFAPVMTIDELDVSAGNASGGQIHERADRDLGEHIVAQWQIPTNVIRSYTPTPAHSLKIITCIGDSNEPVFMPGQRVLVDIEQKIPSPPGFFAIWDGMAEIIKRLEVVEGSDPLRVIVRSANPAYEPYERRAEDLVINGRVIGKWQWT